MNKIIILILALMPVKALAQTTSVAILGDSYSTFQGYLEPDTNAVWYFEGSHDNTDVTKVEQTWWHLLITSQGWKLERNNSFSGSTVCATGYDGEDYWNRSFFNRSTHLGSPDIILVFGATNDCWAHSPIGDYQYDDWTAEQLYSFRPAMACLLYRLLTRYPNTKVYFILNSELSDVINESVYTICRHYGVGVITLSNIEKINGHPSIAGMREIARQVADAISGDTTN